MRTKAINKEITMGTQFKLFSLSLFRVLLLGLTLSYFGAQALASTPDPLHEPSAAKKNIDLDIGVCDPKAGPFSLNINNPYFPLPEERVSILEGDDEGVAVRLQITVLDRTEKVAGVKTRVVEEREWEDDELIEVSQNFFVQAPDGTVCYYGEEVDIYEDGKVVSHEGAWRAGKNGNRPGIIMPANPAVGMKYAQEVAPGIAEDQAEIIAIGKTVKVPAGTLKDTLITRETTPLEPGSESFKAYAAGVGLIVDNVVQLVEVINDNN
jgi:hypothetical protein